MERTSIVKKLFSAFVVAAVVIGFGVAGCGSPTTSSTTTTTTTTEKKKETKTEGTFDKYDKDKDKLTLKVDDKSKDFDVKPSSRWWTARKVSGMTSRRRTRSPSRRRTARSPRSRRPSSAAPAGRLSQELSRRRVIVHRLKSERLLPNTGRGVASPPRRARVSNLLPLARRGERA